MNAPLRVGLLGCGRIAQLFHLGALVRMDGVDLVAVADADAGLLAATTADAPGATGYRDWREVVARPDVDAVVVCLPTNLHAEAAVAAFEAGKHVYVEKPLATSLRDAGAVLDAWRAAGTVGVTGFNFRFHPLSQRARAQIAAGRVGTLVAVRSALCSAPRELPAWKRARHTGGGSLLDLASHHVDLAAFLLDRPVLDVAAVLRSVRTEDDTALLTLGLEGGVPVQTLVSISATQQDRFEIHGDGGTLTLDRYESRDVAYAATLPGYRRIDRLAAGWWELRRVPGRLHAALVPPPEPSFATALRCFADAVRYGVPAGATIADGYRCLAVIEAAERAARERRTVVVAQDRGVSADPPVRGLTRRTSKSSE